MLRGKHARWRAEAQTFSFGEVVEQVGWKLYASGKFEIRQFFLQAGEAWAPWTTAQSKERARRTTCRFPGNRLFALIGLR